MGFLSRFFGTRPKAELTTSRDLAEVLLGYPSVAAGVHVSPSTVMGIAAVQSAVRGLSETVAQLPFQIMKRGAGGARDVARDHSLWGLIHDAPNPDMTAQEFWETLMVWLLLHGNAYAYKVFDGSGNIKELWPLFPPQVEVTRDSDMKIVYRVSGKGYDGKTQYREYTRREILHLRDMSPDALKGESRVMRCREAIGLTAAVERYGALFFGNNATPSGLLTTTLPLKPDQAEHIRESWNRQNSKDARMGTAVLSNGFTWQAISPTPEQAQNLETRKFQIDEIARIFRVPPHWVGSLERATFSNIEHMSQELVTYTLMPWLIRCEGAINTQLMPPKDRANYYAKVNVRGLLRGDAKARGEFYAIMIQNKLMTRNEVRALEDLNPTEGGDIFENPAVTPAPDPQREGQKQDPKEGDTENDKENDPPAKN